MEKTQPIKFKNMLRKFWTDTDRSKWRGLGKRSASTSSQTLAPTWIGSGKRSSLGFREVDRSGCAAAADLHPVSKIVVALFIRLRTVIPLPRWEVGAFFRFGMSRCILIRSTFSSERENNVKKSFEVYDQERISKRIMKKKANET
ncbi:hypothetical protein COM38_07445 [Bacillus toyonensis]|nr:hypothetical protein COM38_07445 [Bacillus toyonensis]